MNSEHDLRGREGHAVELEIAGFLHLPPATGTCAMMVLPMLACQMRNTQVPSRTRRDGSTRPAWIANAPAAVDRLPQLPAPVDEGLVDRHLSIEVVDVLVGPRSSFDRITHLLLLEVAPPTRRLCAVVGIRAPITGAGTAGRRASPGTVQRSGQVLQPEEHALLVPVRAW